MPAINQLISDLQRQGKLQSGMSSEQVAKLAQALQKYSGDLSQRIVGKALDEFKSKITTAQSFTDPAIMRGTLADIGQYFSAPEVADRFQTTMRLTQNILDGAGQFISQNDPLVVDEYPALEFKRLMQREIPRGEKLVKDKIVSIPEDAWDTQDGRWQQALNACGDGEDEKAAIQQVFNETGRMIAPKDSDIWNWLGSTELFEDGTDLQFAPFAWESGFRTVNVSRQECISIGLLEPGDKVSPAAYDPAKLFPKLEEAA